MGRSERATAEPSGDGRELRTRLPAHRPVRLAIQKYRLKSAARNSGRGSVGLWIGRPPPDPQKTGDVTGPRPSHLPGIDELVDTLYVPLC